MKKIITLLTGFAFLLPFAASAATDDVDLTVFETIYTVDVGELIKPTVVSIDLADEQYYGVAIIEDEDTYTSQPYIIIKNKKEKSFNVTNVSALNGSSRNLFDDDFTTTTEFNLDKDKGSAFIEFEANQEITSDFLSLYLDNNVALPYKIAIYAEINGEWKTVVANTKLYSSSISFPETKSKKWKEELKHSQPLVIRELILNDTEIKKNEYQIEVRWLARSGKKYTIYTDAATYVYVPTSERGELEGEELEVLSLDVGDSSSNPLFKEPDYDDDGVPDIKDNCVKLANSQQTDKDENNKGDDCEDDDGDNVMNSKDNCPEHPNSKQRDEDDDGIGDECDDEESRITEKNTWLPWGVMGLSALVVVLLILHTVKREKKS